MDQISMNYDKHVKLNYQLYNSLFLTLPLDAVEQTGNYIPLLNQKCKEDFAQGKDPLTIINEFFDEHKISTDKNKRIDFLFKVIQYVERQIVLVDALEDAAYDKIHRVEGLYSLKRTLERVKERGFSDKLIDVLNEFSVKLVLTAHPTQFYTNQVLHIINELESSIKAKDTSAIRDHLYQLGRTPFYRKAKPEVIDEARSLMEFLNKTFYPAISLIFDKLCDEVKGEINNPELISLGFWPGGDRDGNPFVNANTSLDVAFELKRNIINKYLKDIEYLKRKLTFRNVYEKVIELELLLNNSEINSIEPVIKKLDLIEKIIIKEHQGLFVDLVKSFKRKVQTFGFHFSCLDFRQDSRKISTAHEEFVVKGNKKVNDPVISDVVESIKIIHEIKKNNGPASVKRFIISNTRNEKDVIRLYELFKKYYPVDIDVEIVPLFETIDDLKIAHESMVKLYNDKEYVKHLNKMGRKQTIMLGFSDGTKDGGYLMANWAIYLAKENISRVSKENDVQVVFFDGRGGPPARGGGNTHLFYTSMGSSIQRNAIQLTIQGQTISSQFGTVESAKHNIENLLTAGIYNKIELSPEQDLNEIQKETINELSKIAYEKYSSLKSHKSFLPYLEKRSTLQYYGKTNIGSRPSKRGKGGEFKFEDLRAIPFVGAWSQSKQNVPGYYGLGTALLKFADKHDIIRLQTLYERSIFFRALINNSMQSMRKSFLPLTDYLLEDKEYGDFWKNIKDEFELTKEMILKITASDDLLKDDHRSSESISLRESIVLPLLTIQQYALIEIENEKNDDIKSRYEKMIVRSLFGNINASRNSV